MALDFSKFDKEMDLDGLQKDVQEASQNSGGDFKEVPHDDYEIEINKLELTISKEKKNPMLSCWMKIVEGEYEGSMIFMNQVITQGFQIHIANQFLRSLVEGMDIYADVEFKSYSQYANLILDIAEAIDGKREYLVEYGENKGFNTFKIKKVYDLD
jgi:hypothetical protein